MKISKDKIETKFDFETIKDRDKKVVSEVIDYLKNFKVSKHICEAISQKFKLVELPVYDVDKSHFLRHIKKCNLHYEEQGYIKQGEYPHTIKYPIINVQTEVRNFEKLYASILDEGVEIGKNLKMKKDEEK